MISPPPEPPRKRGRPKGYPKTGGRKKGQKSWSAPEIRDALLGKSGAIDVLADIVAGRPMLCGTERASSETGPGTPVWRYPSLAQRLKGLEILLAKVLPDLKAVEQVVDATVRDVSAPQYDKRQVARAIISVLGSSIEGGYPPSESSGEAWMMPSLPKKSDENSRDRFDSPSTPSENETEVGNYHRCGQPR